MLGQAKMLHVTDIPVECWDHIPGNVALAMKITHHRIFRSMSYQATASICGTSVGDVQRTALLMRKYVREYLHG